MEVFYLRFYGVLRPRKWFTEVTGIRCRDEILHPIVKLFAGAIATELDDSARQHMANIVNQYDEANTIAKIERTLRSPDHNPIDHF